MNVIEWCNTNSGFTSAILSVVGLLLSLIAIIVSISTARLPYRKRLNIGMSTLVGAGTASGLISSPTVIGISVTITNTGNRTISVAYFGYALKKNGKYQRAVPIHRLDSVKCVLHPTDTKDMYYTCDEITGTLKSEKSTCELYAYAIDTEGKEYIKKCGTVSKLLSTVGE